jgi:hypothetical protein
MKRCFCNFLLSYFDIPTIWEITKFMSKPFIYTLVSDWK